MEKETDEGGYHGGECDQSMSCTHKMSQGNTGAVKEGENPSLEL